ncbi:MAG: valine--tRNA ligase [Eubacteriales bacterium]|nr:valine--tRNA ligase [Eubacteriales bacterium]MDY3333026.1 valine--tRNA ligase [Gallibacter sp.]
MAKKEMNKTYDPHIFEDRIYDSWEKNGAFKASINNDKIPFTIVMPPPNITGQLHMGHALDQTIQDVLIRYKRMKGFEALWIPGSDHASIATEVKVLDRLRETEGLEKEDLGREAFLDRVWAWKEEFGGVITQQCRKLGDSCDWERERFTMDEGCNKAVTEFFVRLYEQGYIYRGNRLINWCPDCGTSLSDAEVEHEDSKGSYWYIKYPGVDGFDGIVVATSRPETMFADVAIAVNPEDERYKDYIGKEVYIPTTERKIPIIADEYPNPEKGTGAVKITPGADYNDFEVGERHNLEAITCMTLEAKMNENAGKYEGLDRYECRKQWVEELKEKGYLIKVESVDIPLGTCYRCHNVVEPMLSNQWFVDMNELAKPAIAAAQEGRLTHVPPRFEKIYLHWLDNIRDWCISRQLWWGHRIPAYYCDDCGHIEVSRDTVTVCPKCNSTKVHQDEDVLDTWFSSGLWPFSTLGWPDKTPDLEYFYPTNVLVTGYDIIFFWVVRMVFSALAMTDVEPFDYVYIHGLVRDEQGRKMSKSLGNGVNPLDVIEDVGADALRYMLIAGITPGNDTRYIPKKLEASRNFANKLWNASRFVLMNITDDEGEFLEMNFDETKFNDADKWILSIVNDTTKYVSDNLDKFELSLAAQKVYDVIWNEYCDWYIEISKVRLYGDNEEEKKAVRAVLHHVLIDLLKLLHPFMPFITEEIYSFFSAEDDFIMKSSFPEYLEKFNYDNEVSQIETAKEIIKEIRNIRTKSGAKQSVKLNVLVDGESDVIALLQRGNEFVKTLANTNDLIIHEEGVTTIPQDAVTGVIGGARIYIALSDLVDVKQEIERLNGEKNKLLQEVARCEKMLSNPGFVGKAPKEKIDAEKEKLEKYKDMLASVIERLEILN